jgi:type II secretion system protein H
MISGAPLKRNSMELSPGFTVIELLIILALMGVISAMSLPAFAQWRQNVRYKDATRNIVYMLREARSRAISVNREHRVELDPVNRRYRMTQGDSAQDSTNWDTVVQDWIPLQAEVALEANVSSIHFNPNGTANAGTISVQDGGHITRYSIRIVSTGRIRVM